MIEAGHQRFIVIVPHYNHGAALPDTVQRLLTFDLPIMIVDDGSEPGSLSVARRLADEHAPVTLLPLAMNQGKGTAFITGMRAAWSDGYTHAVQVDADGQHDIERLPELLAASRRTPAALVSGHARYDESVPAARRYGRWITHVCVWIETLSLEIPDAMCGFRIYPLASSVALADRVRIGRHMNFDTDIAVRLHWRGVPFVAIPVDVHYPTDGVSHFRAWQDNVLISAMHTRLLIGMLPRAPAMLLRRALRLRAVHKTRHTARKTSGPDTHTPGMNFRPDANDILDGSAGTNGNSGNTGRQNALGRAQRAGHWSRFSERGSLLGMRILFAIYRLLGRRTFSMLLYPVMGYFWLTAGPSRRASQEYLARVRRQLTRSGRAVPAGTTSFRHFLAFGESILDKIAVWAGALGPDQFRFADAAFARAARENRRGGVFIGSHLGNLELSRAMATEWDRMTINALVFTRHAVKFNQLLAEVNPGAAINLIQVDTLGPESLMQLQDHIAAGEFIGIVGDRTAVANEERVLIADFMGEPAAFPEGPFVLASLLQCPVYLLFCMKVDGYHELHVEPFADPLEIPRGQRDAALQAAAQSYAARLEHFCLEAPLQWFNFYDYWHLPGRPDTLNKS